MGPATCRWRARAQGRQQRGKGCQHAPRPTHDSSSSSSSSGSSSGSSSSTAAAQRQRRRRWRRRQAWLVPLTDALWRRLLVPYEAVALLIPLLAHDAVAAVGCREGGGGRMHGLLLCVRVGCNIVDVGIMGCRERVGSKARDMHVLRGPARRCYESNRGSRTAPGSLACRAGADSCCLAGRGGPAACVCARRSSPLALATHL